MLIDSKPLNLIFFSYGYWGHEIIVLTLSRFYATSTAMLDKNTARPLSREAFIRRVLLPEVAIRLVAEDLGIPAKDPRAWKVVEKSRAYGVALFSDENSWYDLNDIQENMPLIPVPAKPLPAPSDKHAWYFKQLPTELKPFILSIFDPPAFGNCGFLAVANALGMTEKDSYHRIRTALKKELELHREDHKNFLKANEEHLKNPGKARTYDEVNQLLHRLNWTTASCNSEFYMNNSMGYAIASAFEQAVVILDKNTTNCHTYLPYRIRPNHIDPICVLFVDNNHFIRLITSKDFPFPSMYLGGWGKKQNCTVPRWKIAYSPAMQLWVDMFPAPRSEEGGIVEWFFSSVVCM